MEILKKLTSKIVEDILSQYPTYEKRPSGPIGLFRVDGIVNGVTAKPGPYGKDSQCFLGSFAFTRHDTGEEFRSPKCYLPEVGESVLLAAMANSKGSPVAVAFDIGIKPATKSNATRGYEFTLTTVLKPEPSDPLTMLMQNTRKDTPLPALPNKEK